MKIITWNCHHGSIDERLTHVKRYDADLILLQEVKKPTSINPQICWFGNNPKKGHALVVTGDYEISSQLEENADPFFVPVVVEGPINFHLLMVWTQKKSEYVREMKNILNKYQNFLTDRPSIVIGDFNSNAIWDKPHRTFTHSMMVYVLRESFGLTSVYHEKMNCNHGKEKHPTFFLYHKRERPYHIDYCFAPRGCRINDVAIGTYNEWISQSDHCPLIVDVDVKWTREIE